MSPPQTTRTAETPTATREGPVPLLSLVLTGAPRMREHPTEAAPKG